MSVKPKMNKLRPTVAPATRDKGKIRSMAECEREILPPSDAEILASWEKSVVCAAAGRLPQDKGLKASGDRWGRQVVVNLTAEQSAATFAPKPEPKEPEPRPKPVVELGPRGKSTRRRLTKLQLEVRTQIILKFIRDNPDCTQAVLRNTFHIEKTVIKNLCERHGIVLRVGRSGPKAV